MDQTELLSEPQRASTLSPTDAMTAIAATTISPAMRAYSSTSPPCSSDRRRIKPLRKLFMVLLHSLSWTTSHTRWVSDWVFLRFTFLGGLQALLRRNSVDLR